MKFHLMSGGRRSGPFPWTRIQEMAAAGQLPPGTLVRGDHMTEWLPIEEIARKIESEPPPLPLMMPVVLRPKRTLWPWIGAGCLLLLTVSAGAIYMLHFIVTVARPRPEPPPKIEPVRQRPPEADAIEPRPLQVERAGHLTEWKPDVPVPGKKPDEPPPGVLQVVRYPAPEGDLAAYLTPDPKDGQRHPAVLWAHGGFDGIGSYFWDPASKYDDQSARAFREAGLVLMAPSWRGENDNPGRFELFYGEVDDLLAAAAYLAKLPYVDPDRIYLAGHSSGGTLVLLASAASGRFRAVFSLGGMADAEDAIHAQNLYKNAPFDVLKEEESRLRNPLRYVRFITRPTFFFEGDDMDYILEGGRKMGDEAVRFRVPFRAFALKGDHFSIVQPLTELLARKILSDTGPKCSIQFTSTELRWAFERKFALSLAPSLRRWIRQGGDLRRMLGGLPAEDRVPRTDVDIGVMTEAITKVTNEQTGAEMTANACLLAGLLDEAERKSVLQTAQEAFLPTLRRWCAQRLASRKAFDDDEGGDFLGILAVLAEHDPEESTAMILAAAKTGLLSDQAAWSKVLDAYDTENARCSDVLGAFGTTLPAGRIGEALLEAANNALLDGWEGKHPFDSEAGQARLREWLSASSPDDRGQANQAAVALAFLSQPRRDALLPLAVRHPNRKVVMEAAWADLRNHGQRGLRILVDAAKDVHQSKRACSYLSELKHEDQIPAEAAEPGFKARAEMSAWLQHPNELGDPPLTLDLYDQREIFWPPDQEKKRVWLFRFTYRSEDDNASKTGYGMVGGATWSSFREFETPPSPESLYLHHCAMELRRASGDAKAKLDPEAARQALEKGNPGMFRKEGRGI